MVRKALLVLEARNILSFELELYWLGNLQIWIFDLVPLMVPKNVQCKPSLCRKSLVALIVYLLFQNVCVPFEGLPFFEVFLFSLIH